ncbi:tlde1 domain-containing protein [Methylobacterium marchantiae]|uniref:Tlde1 domain-containing protein n=1 Tax=Methylobacterium marchantiae TaxID=600331 RepID=A0ABW3X1W6_9HYPH
MIDDAPSYRRRSHRRRPRSRVLLKTAIVALFVATFPRLTGLEAPVPAALPQLASRPAAPEAPASAATGTYAWMLDPSPAMGARTPEWSAAASEPMRVAAFEPATAPSTPAAVGIVSTDPAPTTTPFRQTARLVQPMPAPVPRPLDLKPLSRQEPRLALRRPSSRTVVAARQNAEAERSFFETVFGRRTPDQTPALAYASADTDAIDSSQRRVLDRVPSNAGGGTAIYDISASTVTLPSGELLEAHSGLGQHMDNPRLVHVRMRGATPPGTYDLTEREALFHGVRALRLTPQGGSAAIHGRDGILAHTYMLGPSGASNGCVVFRDYNRFLQAYLRGEVRRLVVVAGYKGDAPASLTAKLFGR